MTRNLMFIITMGALMMSTGCYKLTPVAAFSVATPESERVVLECNKYCNSIENKDTGTRIDVSWKDDGLFGEFTGDVTLDPGFYSVEVRGIYFPRFSVKLESGHIYTVNEHERQSKSFFDSFLDGEETKYVYYYWIVDKATGEVIAGYAPK